MLETVRILDKMEPRPSGFPARESPRGSRGEAGSQRQAEAGTARTAAAALDQQQHSPIGSGAPSPSPSPPTPTWANTICGWSRPRASLRGSASSSTRLPRRLLFSGTRRRRTRSKCRPCRRLSTARSLRRRRARAGRTGATCAPAAQGRTDLGLRVPGAVDLLPYELLGRARLAGRLLDPLRHGRQAAGVRARLPASSPTPC